MIVFLAAKILLVVAVLCLAITVGILCTIYVVITSVIQELKQ